MRLLVTGIAGFIGSHLGERLLGRGHEVVGVDNFDGFYDRRVKEANLRGLAGKAKVIEGDILDRDLLDRLLSEGKFDGVVHLAALAGVTPSLKQPARYARVNVEGTANVAEAASAHGVPKIVFASSSSVYGGNTKIPFHEDDRVDEPVSPYAATKRAAELVLRSAHHVTGISVTALRYFTVYGPRQRPDMAIHLFTRAIDRGEPVRLRGSGASSRDYTYVDDVITGTVAAVEQPGSGFRVYNLGGERATSLRELVILVSSALGKTAKLETVPAVTGDVERTLADITRARADLGYSPEVGLSEGVRRFVEWYRASAGVLPADMRGWFEGGGPPSG